MVSSAADLLCRCGLLLISSLQRVEVRLINYKKDGTPFINRLRITPLTTSLGQYTHMLGVLEEVQEARPHVKAPAQKKLRKPQL